MTVVREQDAVTHDVAGSSFRSYLSGATGAGLCAWRLHVAPGVAGLPHSPDRDEVALVLEGVLVATINGETTEVGADEVVHVRAGDVFQAGAGAEGAVCWFTTTPGLVATLADGSTMQPPWAQ